jgi:hypothetical protein
MLDTWHLTFMVAGSRFRVDPKERPQVELAARCGFSTKNEFSAPKSSRLVGATRAGPIRSLANPKTLFNGAISPASLNQLQNSHATLVPRGVITRLSSGRRAPRLVPSLNEAGVRRPIF